MRKRGVERAVWFCRGRVRNVTLHTCPPPPIQQGKGGPLEGVGPETHVYKTHNIHYRIQNTEHRIQNTENHVHKITNVPVFYMALGLNDFDAGKSITQLFLAQMALASLVAISGPQKVSIFRASPSNGPCNGSCSHQNHYLPRLINNRYINS